jgi:hypothetical protein
MAEMMCWPMIKNPLAGITETAQPRFVDGGLAEDQVADLIVEETRHVMVLGRGIWQ